MSISSELNTLEKTLHFATEEHDCEEIIKNTLKALANESPVKAAIFLWPTHHHFFVETSLDDESVISEIKTNLESKLEEASKFETNIFFPMSCDGKLKSIFIPTCFQKNCIGLLGLVINASCENEFKEKRDFLMSLVDQAAITVAFCQSQYKIRQYKHEAINAISAVIEALDTYTRDHSRNVANYSLLLAEELHLTPKQIETVYYGALFHDIGKIGISLSILRKKGPLSDDEYEIMKEHPVKGSAILSHIADFKEYLPIILHHHEMFQGGGYPDGLTGEQIPFGARLVSIVDAYDAITTNRAYRKAQGCKTAIDVIIKNAPKQFDPKIVEAFVRVEKNL